MMKRFLRLAMLLCVGTVLPGALSLHMRGAQASTTSGKGSQNLLNTTACGKWSVVPSPNGNTTPSGLHGVAALSATDIWAVGSSGSQSSGAQSLIEHWNGTTWSVVTSPNPGSFYNTLNGVTAVTATNAWAVGYYANSGGITQTLVEHWNGTTWSAVKSANPGIGNALTSVAAVSATNVWAAGYTNSTSTIQSLVEHWNGTTWSVVKSANVGSSPSFWQ